MRMHTKCQESRTMRAQTVSTAMHGLSSTGVEQKEALSGDAQGFLVGARFTLAQVTASILRGPLHAVLAAVQDLSSLPAIA